MTLTPDQARRLAGDLLGDEETAGAPATPRFARCIPESLGRYRIVRLVGAGGMGEVYEAGR